LPLLASAGKLQLALHDTDLDTKTVVIVKDAKQGGTLMFENEAEAGDFNFPAPRTSGSLEDTWRIEPNQLKCRKKSDGELWKLGEGKVETFKTPVDSAERIKAITKLLDVSTRVGRYAQIIACIWSFCLDIFQSI